MFSVTQAGASDLPVLCEMSNLWVSEGITRGLAPNTPSGLKDARCFIARDGNDVVGYAVGSVKSACGMSAGIPDGETYFEIDELYVMKEKRCKGYGQEIYRQIETMVREEGMKYLYLYTATKDYARILDFYIEKLGMTFFSAQLFKAL